MVGVLKRIYQHKITGELSDRKKNHQFEKTSLIFDENTRIIFYCFYKESETTHRGSYVMTPYINKNARNCRFIDGKIVEVESPLE